MAITFQNGFSVGLDLGPTSFTVTSSDFTYANSGYGANGDNTSFIITNNVGPGESFFGPSFDNTNGGNISKADEIHAYFTAKGLTVNNNAYMFNVNWGAGSTVSTGVVILSFYYYNNTNVNLNIGTIDTTVPGWDTPGINMYSGIDALQGIFNFPATFSLYTPLIQNNDSWC